MSLSIESNRNVCVRPKEMADVDIPKSIFLAQNKLCEKSMSQKYYKHGR